LAEIKRIGIGPRMSQVVMHGDHVHFAGICADKAAGGSVAEQTRDILEQIDALLAQAGSDKSRLIEATIWLTSMDRFAEMNQVWDAWVSPGNTPTRACVESPRLARPDFAVEIRVLAARDQRAEERRSPGRQEPAED
jgi:enamine deaminase RidA (YjgF/YER057c/UK114 family)